MERRSLPCDLIDFARTVVTQRVGGLIDRAGYGRGYTEPA